MIYRLFECFFFTQRKIFDRGEKSKKVNLIASMWGCLVTNPFVLSPKERTVRWFSTFFLCNSWKLASFGCYIVFLYILLRFLGNFSEMLAVRSLGMARVSVRAASQAFQAVPTNAGKVPPKLEDFDPLNPGEWQLGVGFGFFLVSYIYTYVHIYIYENE